MAQRITNEMLDLVGANEAMVEPRNSYEDDMKALIHLEREAENASMKDYEKVISSTSENDKIAARKVVEDLLKYAQTGLKKSDGEAVNNCVKAVFDAYTEDGSAGIARALKMLEE